VFLLSVFATFDCRCLRFLPVNSCEDYYYKLWGGPKNWTNVRQNGQQYIRINIGILNHIAVKYSYVSVHRHTLLLPAFTVRLEIALRYVAITVYMLSRIKVYLSRKL